MTDKQMTDEEWQEKKNGLLLQALRTIKSNCELHQCGDCPFSEEITDDCLIVHTKLPFNWEIGVFKNGKLLR